MLNKPTPTIEDYLGIIYTLQRDDDEIYGARLAELLNVSAPTVTVTIRRMVRDGWIQINSSKKISLTAAGINAARAVIRRHMLTEWMLAKILQVPWSEVHEEADRIEHVISDDVEKNLSATLDAPELCPHGNPMPGSESVSNDWVALTDCVEKDQIIIRRVHEFLEDNHEILQLLESENIMPGCIVTVNAINLSDRTLSLITNGKIVNLDFEISGYIFVEHLT